VRSPSSDTEAVKLDQLQVLRERRCHEALAAQRAVVISAEHVRDSHHVHAMGIQRQLTSLDTRSTAGLQSTESVVRNADHRSWLVVDLRAAEQELQRADDLLKTQHRELERCREAWIRSRERGRVLQEIAGRDGRQSQRRRREERRADDVASSSDNAFGVSC